MPPRAARTAAWRAALGAASAAVVLCCLTATYWEAPAVLLSPERSQADYTAFFERNALLNERQRALDEARRQVLLQVLGQGAENKAFSQSLYMETDAAPSTGMLQEYWKDFTALPPSKRPGLGLAESPDDIDARISRLRQRSAQLGQVAQSAAQRAAFEDADDEDDNAVAKSRGARRMKLDEIDDEASRSLMASEKDDDKLAASLGTMASLKQGLMASDSTMAGGGNMAGAGTMAGGVGNMADGGGVADTGHMFDVSRMASRRGLQAGGGSMAGDGLLSGTNRILAGDGILANDGLLSSYGHGMAYKSAAAPRLSILAQEHRADTGTQREVWIDRFVPAWRPWLHCATDGGAESRAVCRAMRRMGERGADGMGGTAKYSFRPASRQSLRETQASGVQRQQRVASRELLSQLEPLNVMQAQLNLERLKLVRALLLPELEVEDAAGDAHPVMMVEEKGRLVRAVLYTDISNGSDGGFNAPYDLNGDGQYVDNWAKVSTDWSYTQPTGGYLSPMPGSNPGPDSMGGRPFVTWKGAGPRRLTQLTGSVPDWTQSPWLSVFSEASARQVRDSPAMKALGLDLTDTTAPAEADTPTADVIPDYQRVSAKNSPAHTRFQYSAPRRNGADCNTLSNEGCAPEAVQGASDTGRPLYLEYHPLRLVPEYKFAKGKNVEAAADEAAAARDAQGREQDADQLNDQDYPKTLEEFDARRAASQVGAVPRAHSPLLAAPIGNLLLSACILLHPICRPRRV